MVHNFNPVCFDAFAELLAQPDPVDLPRRSHVYRWEGDPDRRVTRLPGILMASLQRRYLATDEEEAPASAKRMVPRRTRRVNPGLRVLHLAHTG